MSIVAPVIPGDQISALGHTFTVWSILYQDRIDDIYDVEFIDDQDRYHHWKQAEDGGQVIRSGECGAYFRETSGAAGLPVIACIRPRRRGPGYTAKIIYRAGPEIFLGSRSTYEGALEEINRYGASHGLCWKEM